jgi:hypothetical protein
MTQTMPLMIDAAASGNEARFDALEGQLGVSCEQLR